MGIAWSGSGLSGLSGLSGRGEQTALLVGSATVPGTFAPSLVPRSVIDQGIVTGLGATLSYVLTVANQDLIEAAASLVAPRLPGPSAEDRQRTAALLLDLSVIPAGLAAQRLLPRRAHEPVARGLTRQAAWRTTVTGVGGATFALAQAGANRLDARLGADGRLARMPLAVPIGLGIAWVIELRRRDRVEEPTDEQSAGSDEKGPAPIRGAAAAVGVVGALSVAAYAESLLARTAGYGLASLLPGPQEVWRLTGHAACLGALVAGGTVLFDRAMQGIEAGTTTIEPLIDDSDGHRFVGETMSGGPGSLVPWASLGREGRRHAIAYVRPRTEHRRPEGFPDLSIETVMGEPPRATPVQVYVGLDSAPTAKDRVQLALDEMDRTGAWDRSLIMLVSPTGTGYVNYCAVAATQYLTRGDVATVTLQYSKRPSPLSLGKIKDAREQNRLLWLHIAGRLRSRPGPRPRVVLFGESLGAHTSQDVLMHWGTLGPEALGIDRALWIGTPYASKWKHQVTSGERPDVDSDLVATVNDFEQIRAMPTARRERLRFVMVSHDNDGVTKFGADLVATRPRWLSDERPPVELVDGASPRGVPQHLRWRPITTFLHSLVDMKNAQIPGAYRSWAHDYRPDLPEFIREVFDLPASDEQLQRVAAALEERESVRERLFAAKPKAEESGPQT